MQPAFSRFLRPRPWALAPALALSALAGGCFLGDTGISPPENNPYFPTALAISPGRTTLYVVNSDFDLQYTGGTVQAIDLEWMRDRWLTPLRMRLNEPPPTQDQCDAMDPPVAERDCHQCGLAGLAKNPNRILNPSPCSSIAPAVEAFAGIGAFASGAVLATNPVKGEKGARLFVTVRGDPSVTWFDIPDDREEVAALPPRCEDEPDREPGDGKTFCLMCDISPDDETRRCGDSHRMGIDPYQNLRHVIMPVEPVGIDIADDGKSMVVAHQTEFTVSLSVNGWGAPTDEWGRPPSFQFSLPGVADGPTDVTRLPQPAIAGELGATNTPYQPGFLVSYRNAAQVDLFRYNDDGYDTGGPSLGRPFITRVAQIPINTNADGRDSRGIAVDASERQRCEDACPVEASEARRTCLLDCTYIPLDLFIANRLPPSLVLGRIDTHVIQSDEGISGIYDTVETYDTVPLAVGASRIGIGKVIAPDGTLQPRVFAVAFDSRLVFSYDPRARRVDAVIRTGRGPHAISFDTDPNGAYSHLLVGHFTDSYLGVVDLDMRNPGTFGTMFAAIGERAAPKESR